MGRREIMEREMDGVNGLERFVDKEQIVAYKLRHVDLVFIFLKPKK
jgi:hypothetical protein